MTPPLGKTSLFTLTPGATRQPEPPAQPTSPPKASASAIPDGYGAGRFKSIDGTVTARPATVANADDPFSEERLMADMHTICVDHGGRTFGTHEGWMFANWLAKRFEQIGCEPGNGNSYLQGFTSRFRDAERTGHNIIAKVPGTDPHLADEVVIVSCHADSQEGTSHGAHDNASGIAAVLAAAEDAVKNPSKRTRMFVAYDGEEGLRVEGKYWPGRRGSRFFAEHPPVPLEKIAFQVNADMIGLTHLERGSRDEFFGWTSDDRFAREVYAEATQDVAPVVHEGYPEQPYHAQFFTTDVEALWTRGVPTINLLSGRDFENHGEGDNLYRIIPERLALYSRVTGSAVSFAANDSRSMADLGIAPGPKLAALPLLNARRSMGGVLPEDEKRIKRIQSRVPALKAASSELVERLEDPITELRAGLQWKTVRNGQPLLSEYTLNEVRVRRAALIGQLREIPKDAGDARQKLQSRVQVLSGVEEIISAALYLSLVDANAPKSQYHLEQVPARIAELERGAARLGLAHLTDGVILPDDIGPARMAVNSAEAVELAREGICDLHAAIAESAFMLLNPDDPMQVSRALSPRDLGQVKAELFREVSRVLGKPEPAEHPNLIRAKKTAAFLEQSLMGIRGGSWLSEWKDQNFLYVSSFPDFIQSLELEPAAERKLIELSKNLAKATREKGTFKLDKAIMPFYLELLELTFKEARVSLDKIGFLSGFSQRGDLEELLAQRRSALSARNVSPEDLEQVKHRPEIKVLLDRKAFIEGTLKAVATVEKAGKKLYPGASLTEAHQALTAHQQRLAVLEGSQSVQEEVAFWADWLQPFAEVEAAATEFQTKRDGLAGEANRTIEALVRRAAEELGHPIGDDFAAGAAGSNGLRAERGTRRMVALALEARRELKEWARLGDSRSLARFQKLVPDLAWRLEAAPALAEVEKNLLEGANFDRLVLQSGGRKGPLEIVFSAI